MIESWQTEALRAALKAVGPKAPKNLVTRAAVEAKERGSTFTAEDLTCVLETAAAPDPFLTELGLRVAGWDVQPAGAAWAGPTLPSTEERRTVITTALGMTAGGAAALLRHRPIFKDGTTVITAPWEKWYTADRAGEHEFYWPRYRDYLLNVRKWPEDNVSALDTATSHVVERLGDPTREEAHRARGLVVGYVQSGKTANFTGVAAKAIDAGYRLVIVMTGTIELLRAQTQRRMDMEMVGRQNIIADLDAATAKADGIDYQDDPDWIAGRFVDLGDAAFPTEIHRLTKHKRDYQKQFKSLKIDRHHMTRPLYDPENLFPTAARLVITKKNSTVLKKLVTDLKANAKAFAEIPVLIIDDESDQASVNTVDPEKVRQAKSEGKEIVERRAINQRISEMLALMPRAQYVGYTATPFANVFVDPSDSEGIFPKDFVIGLQRPPGYMGVEDFHDFALSDDVEQFSAAKIGNKDAHVRELTAPSDDPEARDTELSAAVDAFVLTGACKLYRTANGQPEFKHHTMLVHETVTTKSHKSLAERVSDIWKAAEFSKPSGLKRLRLLYEGDVLPVSRARREANSVELPEFDALKPFIAKSIARITEHSNNPVIVVNSDQEIAQQQQALDFDRNSTWRILIGGAKLSRGFTVEGLTVTYFRRATNMSDSLTQMGRWFGFREGYRDLVRLYIDTRAKFGARTVDLYEAFQNIAMDEAEFRQQLARYAEWDGDKPRVLPSQIPPLVSQHLPWLKPTAGNKMFNAVLEEQSEQFFRPSGHSNHVDDQFANLELWRPLLSKAQALTSFPAGNKKDLQAFTSIAPATYVIDIVEQLHWMILYGERTVQPKVNYYRRLMAAKDPLLKSIAVVLPQPDVELIDLAGVGPRRLISRDRRVRGDEDVSKFGEITDPKHRQLVEPLLEPQLPAGHPLEELWAPDRGVLLVYLVRESEPHYDKEPKAQLPDGHPERGVIVGFSLYLPRTAMAERDVVRFRVLKGTDETVAAVSTDP